MLELIVLIITIHQLQIINAFTSLSYEHAHIVSTSSRQQLSEVIFQSHQSSNDDDGRAIIKAGNIDVIIEHVSLDDKHELEQMSAFVIDSFYKNDDDVKTSPLSR